MTRFFHRLAVAATALPVALLGASGTAHADPAACFGASSVTIICDPTVTPTTPLVEVESYTYTEEVCVASVCRNVDVRLVRLADGGPLEVCVSWVDRDGTPGGNVCFVESYLPPAVYAEVCAMLDDLAGSYGPVGVNSQGDVYVDGAPFHDCPPYDIDWS